MKKKIPCLNCGDMFTPGKTTSRFCCLSCSVTYTSKHMQKTVKCTTCPSIFQFTGRTSPRYCLDCRKKAHRTAVSKFRVKTGAIKHPGVGSGGAQWGQMNHQWMPPEKRKAKKTPYVGNYRNRAYRYWGKQCVICGSTDQLCVHHIDGNPSNCTVSNTVPVCLRHHYKLHYRRRNYSVQDRRTVLFQLWPEGECRIKIAELSGKTLKRVTRTEGGQECQPGATHSSRGSSPISCHEAATPRGENIC